MVNADFSPLVKMSEADFLKYSTFIYDNFGINMTIAKKVMLESRLQKRLKTLGITSFRSYFDLINSPGGDLELMQMIDVVSTNKTDFFREPVHFDFLASQVLPAWQWKKSIRIWSAGCSSGEEPYSIAIAMAEFNLRHGHLDYQIMATDISTAMLKKGMDAVYGIDRVTHIPLDFKMKYMLKSKDQENPTIRITPELRKRVTFERLNFMDEMYSQITGSFDVIFCRNVIIYFDRKTQEKVINRLCRKLNKGGILFLGHSESTTDFVLPLEQIKPTIYRRV